MGKRKKITELVIGHQQRGENGDGQKYKARLWLCDSLACFREYMDHATAAPCAQRVCLWTRRDWQLLSGSVWGSSLGPGTHVTGAWQKVGKEHFRDTVGPVLLLLLPGQGGALPCPQIQWRCWPLLWSRMELALQPCNDAELICAGPFLSDKPTPSNLICNGKSHTPQQQQQKNLKKKAPNPPQVPSV